MIKLDNIKNYKGGWFVGDFSPTLFTSPFEVAVKSYKKGEINPAHYHKYSTEINVVVDGSCLFTRSNEDKITLTKDDIIVIGPYESTTFEALEDCRLVVVKTDSKSDDKILGKP